MTVFAMQGGLLGVMSGIILFAFRKERRRWTRGGAHWLAAGYLLGGIGMLLLAFERAVPMQVLNPVGCFLLLAFPAFLLRGLLTPSRDREMWFYLLLGVDAVGIAFFYDQTYVHPHGLVRSIASAVLSVGMYGAVIRLLHRNSEGLVRPAVKAVIWLLWLQIAIALVRLVIWHWTRTQTWFVGVNIITGAGVAMAYLWMNYLVSHAELEQSAMTDPLTGLYNRRAAEVLGAQRLRVAMERCEPCSALMIDIDRFKELNDKLGHMAGDTSLRALAAVLRDAVRHDDMASRFGGDEFFVLLPCVNEAGVMALVRRIEERMLALNLATLDGIGFTFEITIGQVTLHGDGIALDDLLHASDLVLYERKEAKRAEQVFVQAPNAGDGFGTLLQ